LWRPLSLFVLIGFLLVGCGSTKTETFEGRLHSIKDGFFIVNCTDEVNKGSEGEVISAVGYTCGVELTESTKFLDENGMDLTIKDFPLESNVRVVLVRSENIKEKIEKEQQLNLVAKEIIMLNK
jgi:hypothetical protein